MGEIDYPQHPWYRNRPVCASATPATGNLTITLRHLPNKSGVNVPGGDITNAGGGTDAEVVFPVVVQ